MSMSKKFMTAVLAIAITVGFIPFTGLASESYGATGKVGVDKGATKIFEGMATDDKDITIYNDKIAASFAVGSNNYWNMTKGSILDIGVRGAGGTEGDYGVDLVNDVELLGDLWTSTGTYKGTDLRTDVEVTYDLAEDGSKVDVTSKYRYWVQDVDKDGKNDDALPLNITQVYTLKAGDNFISMKTTVENPNTDLDYKNMYTGYSISTNAAHMFGPYGYYPDTKATGVAVGDNEDVQEYFGKFVTTYKDNYAVTLEMDGTNAYKGSSGYKDIYKHQDLKAGKTYEFVGEVLVSDSNETATVMDRFVERENIASDDIVTVEGTIKDKDGNPVENASIIAKKMGTHKKTVKSHGKESVDSAMQPFVWFTTGKDGKYKFTLPKTGYNDGTENIGGNGEYKYQFKIEAAGYSELTTEEMSITEDLTKDYTIQDGARVKLTAVDADGNKIPFRVEVEGVTPEIKTAGVSTFFSDALASDPYSININMTQAKNVTFKASFGKDFESDVATYKTNIGAKGLKHTFVIDEVIDPEAEGWYSVDNHQHSNFGDGATQPAELFNAQIAAKLDANLVADHDSRSNVYYMSQLAKQTGRTFISNMEVSPGWGHWGVLNVNYADGLNGPIVDATVATPQDIIKTGHQENAVVIMHHPYSDYGFLNNQDSVNGGHAEGWNGFDLLELQSTMDLAALKTLDADKVKSISMDQLSKTLNDAGITQMDAKALVTAMKFWNEGTPKYLSGGSDQHQATSPTLYPGIIRVYANMEKFTIENYLSALKAGHAYVTCGPMLFPDKSNQFGETINVTNNQKTTLKLDAQAINGLKEVTLYGNGVPLETKTDFQDGRNSLEFEVTPVAGENTWYSFVAQDNKGQYAASNPIWVKCVTAEDYTEAKAEAEEAKAEAEEAKAAAEEAKAEATAAKEEAATAKTEAEEAKVAVENAGTDKAKAEEEAKAAAEAQAKAEAEAKAAAEKQAKAEADAKAAVAAANTAHKKAFRITSSSKSVKATATKKKAVATSKVAVTGNMTKVTYKKASGSSKLTINKTSGKITVKKGTKKGTYKIKVKATTAKSDIFTSISKTKTITVKVK